MVVMKVTLEKFQSQNIQRNFVKVTLEKFQSQNIQRNFVKGGRYE